MALSPKQTQLFLELLDRVVLLLPALPELKASFTDTNSLFKTLLKEGRDPTDEELNAIRDENNTLYEQLQSS